MILRVGDVTWRGARARGRRRAVCLGCRFALARGGTVCSLDSRRLFPCVTRDLPANRASLQRQQARLGVAVEVGDGVCLRNDAQRLIKRGQIEDAVTTIGDHEDLIRFLRYLVYSQVPL